MDYLKLILFFTVAYAAYDFIKILFSKITKKNKNTDLEEQVEVLTEMVKESELEIKLANDRATTYSKLIEDRVKIEDMDLKIGQKILLRTTIENKIIYVRVCISNIDASGAFLTVGVIKETRDSLIKQGLSKEVIDNAILEIGALSDLWFHCLQTELVHDSKEIITFEFSNKFKQECCNFIDYIVGHEDEKKQIKKIIGIN